MKIQTALSAKGGLPYTRPLIVSEKTHSLVRSTYKRVQVARLFLSQRSGTTEPMTSLWSC